MKKSLVILSLAASIVPSWSEARVVRFVVEQKRPLANKVPRNERGMVEFSAPFVIRKPVDLAKGNHKIFELMYQ